jgi:hypothetical protein
MPVICPTGQEVFEVVVANRRAVDNGSREPVQDDSFLAHIRCRSIPATRFISAIVKATQQDLRAGITDVRLVFGAIDA